MDKDLENKLDEMIRTIKVGFDEVHEKMVTKEDLEILESKLTTEIQKTKLDSLDKYATNERVDKQEIRIQNLESKIA